MTTGFPIKRLLPLFMATIFGITAMGAVIPILPFYVEALEGSRASAPLIFSCFSLAAFLSSPLWGSLSDRYGRKIIMMLSIMGTMLSYGLLAMADNLIMLYSARILAGLCAGWMVSIHAYVADVTDESQRAKGMGMMGAGFGIGFTLGPAIGGFIMGMGGFEDFIWPSLLAFGFSGVALLVILCWLQEPPHIKSRIEKGKNFVARYINPIAFRNKTLRHLLALYFMVFLVFTAIEGVFAIWAAQKLGYGVYEVGLILAYGGIITIFVQGWLIGKLTHFLTEKTIILMAIFCLFSSLCMFLLTHNIALLLLTMFFLAMAMGLHNPTMQSLISKAAREDLKGTVMGNAQSLMSLARVFGPAWVSLIFGLYGYQAPFMIGALFAAILFILAIRILKSS